MFANNLEVAVESSKSDSFATVSSSFIKDVFTPMFGTAVPPVVPVKLIGAHGHTCYVGCLTQRPHQKAKKLFLSVAMTADLGLTDGEVVQCVPLLHVPQATRVLVDPLTVDESEVVEHNASLIENQLLRQIQVVSPHMAITVQLFPGMRARVRVSKIECGDTVVEEGCVLMFEGTLFVVATRARVEAPKGQSAVWGVFRAIPAVADNKCEAVEETVVGKKEEGTGSAVLPPPSPLPPSSPSRRLAVSPAVATRNGWVDGSTVGALDLALVSCLEGNTLSPSFLREHVAAYTLVVDQALQGEMVHADDLVQPTNMLVLPRPEDVVTVASSGGGGAGGGRAGDKPETAVATGRAHGRVPDSALPTLEELDAVHERVPSGVLSHVLFALQKGEGDNILLSGAKGYGKTAVVQRVLRSAQRSAVAAHTIYVDCVESKSLLPELKRCMQECLLCSPAVLVLDNFDRIAPSQAEGHAQSISDKTQAELELLLSMNRRVVSLVGGCKGIVVLATCANRDTVHEYFRSAYLFPTSLTLGPLTRATRTTLVQQLLSHFSLEEQSDVVSFMENFTAFDAVHFVDRVKSVYYQQQKKASTVSSASVSAKDCAAQCAEAYKPIAHAGIKFLKGEKLVWDSIGGLAEAKKALYDTLVLPMHHPQLFARLPLKTRSGLLLYGPSGCGKTFVVESIVNAQSLNCIVVNGPEVFGKYIGQSEQKIRDIFERAQAAAPCVIFFDEFESVAPQRGADNSGVTDRVVNQLLCYMDGVEGRKDVYVVAASSRPDLIDAALLRPGRLDKAVCCPVPSEGDRAAILRFLLDNVKADVSGDDIAQIAAQTDRWTPADLSAVVATANTLVSQRIIEQLTRAAKDHESAGAPPGDGAGDDELFIIAEVGAHTTREKVASSLDFLKQKTTTTLTARQQEERITVADVRAAMATTRPSLTPADIAKHERIHKLFSKGETPHPVPGSKVITA